MKIIKTIDSKNGEINVYDNDIYMLDRPYYSYKSLVDNREDLIYNLLETGFVIKNIEFCLGKNKKGLIFYLRISMLFSKENH